MDTLIKTAGVCICAVCAVLILGDRQRSAAILCSVAAFAAVAAFCISGSVSTITDTLEDMYASTYFGEYAELLLKALGISYITCAASEICNAAGEGMLARITGICGRAELLVLCMPMLARLLEIASGMLENV